MCKESSWICIIHLCGFTDSKHQWLPFCGSSFFHCGSTICAVGSPQVHDTTTWLPSSRTWAAGYNNNNNNNKAALMSISLGFSNRHLPSSVFCWISPNNTSRRLNSGVWRPRPTPLHTHDKLEHIRVNSQPQVVYECLSHNYRSLILHHLSHFITSFEWPFSKTEIQQKCCSWFRCKASHTYLHCFCVCLPTSFHRFRYQFRKLQLLPFKCQSCHQRESLIQ